MIPFNSKEEKLEEQVTFLNSTSADVSLRPLYSEESLLYRLRPSHLKQQASKPQAKIVNLIKSIFKWTAQFFVISRPNLMKEKLPMMIRSGNSQYMSSKDVSWGNLWEHYQQFLHNENPQCSSELKKCFDRLKEDESLISSLQRKEKEVKTILQKQEKMNLQKIVSDERHLLIENNLEEIYKMSEGTSRILILPTKNSHSLEGVINHQVFFIINKQSEEKYSIHLMGAESVLNEQEVIFANGKKKFIPELCFENIPKETLEEKGYLKEILTDWADHRQLTPESMKEKIDCLSVYKKQVDPIIDLKTYSDRTDRLFWNTVNFFSAKSKNKQVETSVEGKIQQKQLKLKADIFSLFDLFQSVGEDLKPHTSDYQILVQVFKGVSEKILFGLSKTLHFTKRFRAIKKRVRSDRGGYSKS